MTAGTISRVGPHGFIHGWIFVGVPVTGDRVHHPRHGHGTVAGHGGSHVTVQFDKGHSRTFHVEHDPQRARQLERMSDEDVYKHLMSRGEGDHFNRGVAELERRDAAERESRVQALYAEHPATADDKERVYQQLVDAGENPEDAWAHAHGTSAGQERKRAVIAQLKQQGYRGSGFEQLARESFKDEVRRRTLDAESATNGYMLTPAGKREGIDPWSLFTGPETRARKWASPELREWWDQHGRPTFNDWQSMLTGAGGVKDPRGGDFYA